VEWTPEAATEIKNVSSYLYEKYSGSIDIPLVVNDVRDKVCRFSQSVAALLHSTVADDPNRLRVLPEHVQIVRDEIFDAIYSHENCKLNEYSQGCRNETKLTDEDYIAVLEDIRKIKNSELDGSNTDDLLEIFREDRLVSLSELMDMLGLVKSTVSKRIAMLKKHGLIRSSKKGYYKTPKMVIFLRRMKSDENEISTEE
jgi:biotin operon repressor